MKLNSKLFTGFVLFAALALNLQVHAQRGMGMKMGMGTRGGFMNDYDTSKVQTIEGTVTETDSMQCPGMKGPGRHVTISTGSENVDVHLGPASFLEKHSFALATGDKIRVTGARTTFNSAPAMLAREVKRGNTTLVLRTTRGVPLWSRGMMR